MLRFVERESQNYKGRFLLNSSIFVQRLRNLFPSRCCSTIAIIIASSQWWWQGMLGFGVQQYGGGDRLPTPHPSYQIPTSDNYGNELCGVHPSLEPLLIQQLWEDHLELRGIAVGLIANFGCTTSTQILALTMLPPSANRNNHHSYFITTNNNRFTVSLHAKKRCIAKWLNTRSSQFKCQAHFWPSS